MNIKLLLVIVLYILILSLLFYFLDIESNIIILLSIVILLLLNKIINNLELFQDPNNNSNCSANFETVTNELDDIIIKLKKTLRNIQTKNGPRPLKYEHSQLNSDTPEFIRDIDSAANVVQELQSK